MNKRGSTYIQSAKANQRIEDGLQEKLDEARIYRDLCWLDFYSNLDETDTNRLRLKLNDWERADSEVARLEAKAGLYNEHHRWVANYDKLVEAGYKE